MLNVRLWPLIDGFLQKALFFFLALASLVSYGQNKLVFTQLQTTDGLSSNTVKAILKDRYGLMWFATEDGLNRYDGRSFKVYRHIADDTTSLLSNDINTVYEDRVGNLWVGTNGGYLSKYNRESDIFIHAKANGLNRSVSSICEDSKGMIWAATFGTPYLVDPGSVRLIKPDNQILRVLGNRVVTRVLKDSKKRLWMATNDGIFLFDKNNKFVRQLPKFGRDSGSSGKGEIKVIIEDNDLTIWIGTSEGLYREDNGQFVHHRIGDRLSSVYSIDIAPNGQLWLGTEYGLYVLDKASGNTQHYLPDIRDGYSISNKSVRSIFIDEEGIYWLGIFQGGINKYDSNLTLFSVKRRMPFDAYGLNGNIVTSFAQYDADNLFLGTDDAGLALFHPARGLFERINLDFSSEARFSVLALETAKDRELWVGTFGNGLFRYDPVSKSTQKYTRQNTQQKLLSNEVFAIKSDTKGNIWIGHNGEGLSVFRNGNFYEFSKRVQTSDFPKLPLNGYIRDIEEDLDGNIWIASQGTGLAKFHIESKQVRVYNMGNSGLSNDVVLTLHIDRAGNVWMGTLGGALCFMQRGENSIENFGEKQGLNNNTIYAVIEDQYGMIWMSTNVGISSFDPKSKRFRNYNRNNGVINNNFVKGAAFRTNDNTLYFGSLEGFNYFNTAGLKKNRNVPKLIFTDLKIDNQVVNPGKEMAISTQLSVAKDIHLEYKQNFSISYVALNYTIPQQNQYAYKLEGFDKKWNYVGINRTAAYTNLNPGTYLFRVKASNNDGVWNEKGIKIKIYVHPPFWMNIYAYIFYGISLVSTIIFIRRRELVKLRHRFDQEQAQLKAEQVIVQERKETERVRELDQMKLKFLTNLSHEFRTPIGLVLAPVEDLIKQEKDKSISEKLHMIRRNGKRLLNLVNQLLDFRKIEEQELHLKLKENDLVAFLQEVKTSFDDLAERRNISYWFTSELTYFRTQFDPDKLERILFNLLSNAFKFTPAEGEIGLELLKTNLDENSNLESGIFIKVNDTGIGIASDKLDKIFDRFFQSDNQAVVLNQGSGIGLSITQEFVKMHGGSIHVESKLGVGSVFTIFLPFDDIGISCELEYLIQEDEITEEIVEDLTPPTIANDHLEVVLLVEDNDDFRFYLKDNLKARYKIVEACNGKEGWQKALSCHPMLIVSDVNMPYMDGVELSRKIKADKRTSHIPLILLTALSDDKNQLEGLGAGANDYLAKPFNVEILQAKIRNLLLANKQIKDTYSKQILVGTPELEVVSDQEKLLKKITRYLEDNLTNPQLSVQELSEHVAMSRGALYNRLLELTGQTPVEFIRNFKLQKSLALLEKTDYNIAQIAYTVGFATPNYFAKSFKARYGMLPSAYAMQHKSNIQN